MKLRLVVRCLAILAMPLWAVSSAPLQSTSCCTQEEIQSCYASVTPENGCGVSYVGCGPRAICFCAVDCPQ
jgi:hypothetical protein